VFGCANTQLGSSGAVQRTPVTVRSSLDRTAIWVGDPVTYTVDVDCLPGYDIIEGDLGRDHLPLEGLEVRTANTAREARDGGAVAYRARFQLSSYTPERERLRIGPMSIRYYRKQPDGRIDDRIPDGVADVPGQDIALHSTLPDSAGLALRSAKTPVLLPPISHLIYPFGLALVALSLIAVALGFSKTIGRRTSTETQDSARRQPTDYQLALNDIRQLSDTANAEALRQAFGRLDHLLREFFAEMNPHARSVTPEEIDAEAGTGGDLTTPRAIARVLRECERARYGGPTQPPSHELLIHTLDQAEAVLVSDLHRQR
jgi:hypothetical protein